ncbi:MAG: oxidoreductase [Hoeflea sp. BRH_c9]|nr:MAG: oxidoreductase [Hoeflea sp. BRH_c9]
MTVIWTRDGIVENDPWIGADSAQGRRLLGLAEALDHALDNVPFGVVLQPAEDVRALAPILDRLAIIALTFPAFSDGRAFSQAMLLRERLAYKGELRAIGTVLLDQVPLMLRTGFDSFEVSHAPTIARLAEKRLPGIDLHYQPAADQAGAGPSYSWRRTATLNG